MFFRGQIIGKYKILSTIGSGGFGTITSLNSNISMRQLQVSLKLVF